MKIFIADYLPLANKGEEEILRGIEALFKSKKDEEVFFSVFGDVNNTECVDNVTVYPKDICYPDNGHKGFVKTLLSIFWGVLDEIGIYPYSKNLAGVFESLKISDRILIGHDGFFNIRCAMLGNYLHRRGLHYAILGAGFNKPSKKIAWIYNRVFRRCFDGADYVVLREQTAYNYVKSISKNGIIKLFPDPAFFCPSDAYNKERIDNIFSKYLFEKAEGMKIGMTVCEDSISFSHAFVDSPNKVHDHREFIAKLMNTVGKKYKCTFFFLPHCIKDGKGNDLYIAKDIKNRLDPSVNCIIIEEDMPVLDLKYLISTMDLIVGERTHSIINSISTLTPFISMTCSADFRTHDIVGDGCKLPLQVYDMDYPDINVLVDLTDKTIENSRRLIDKLQVIQDNHESVQKDFQEIL